MIRVWKIFIFKKVYICNVWMLSIRHSFNVFGISEDLTRSYLKAWTKEFKNIRRLNIFNCQECFLFIYYLSKAEKQITQTQKMDTTWWLNNKREKSHINIWWRLTGIYNPDHIKQYFPCTSKMFVCFWTLFSSHTLLNKT